MSLVHGFPKGNTSMTYLDRHFFILDSHVKELEVHVGLVESETRELDARVHPGTPTEVRATIKRLERLLDRIDSLQGGELL